MPRSPSTTSAIEPGLAAPQRTRRRASRRLPRRWLAVAAFGLAASWPCLGQSVALSGRLGDKALLVVDGTPRTVTVGGSVDGVRLLSVDAQQAVVEMKGQRISLPIGATPVSLGRTTEAASGGSRIVLQAGSGGHFASAAKINGREVRLLVDTGATNVILSEAEAERIGLDFRQGAQGYTQTANGMVRDHRVALTSLQIGDVVVHQVQATVLPAPMTHILAGNSYLSRFRMKIENDTLTLEKRF